MRSLLHKASTFTNTDCYHSKRIQEHSACIVGCAAPMTRKVLSGICRVPSSVMLPSEGGPCYVTATTRKKNSDAPFPIIRRAISLDQPPHWPRRDLPAKLNGHAVPIGLSPPHFMGDPCSSLLLPLALYPNPIVVDPMPSRYTRATLLKGRP